MRGLYSGAPAEALSLPLFVARLKMSSNQFIFQLLDQLRGKWILFCLLNKCQIVIGKQLSVIISRDVVYISILTLIHNLDDEKRSVSLNF